MTDLASCIYHGVVVHKRLSPKQHAFSYRVFALCLDVDEIDHLDRSLRLFSRNRFNLLSFHDSDLGDGDGAPIGERTRRLLDDAGFGSFGARIEIVCYPRVLGYVFNPLSVYFCRDRDGRLGTVIYEVSNTFRERKSYVIGAGASRDGVLTQSCDKELYVSPFTQPAGTYEFHMMPPAERALIGVALREAGEPVLKTHFNGKRLALDDRAIAAMWVRHPLMTLKVISAIHVEAARLWTKGVPLVTRHTSPAFSTTIIGREDRGARHA
jgi:uncharacterized protein